jgi:hypothetical protein
VHRTGATFYFLHRTAPHRGKPYLWQHVFEEFLLEVSMGTLIISLSMSEMYMDMTGSG